MAVFVVGQIFTGGATVGASQTGQAAFLQIGTVDFTGATPNAIADVVVSKDILASATSYSGATIQSFTVTSVAANQVVTLTTNDLPPGVTIPPGFTLPQNVRATLLGLTANISTVFGSQVANGSVAVIGAMGSLELVGHANFATTFGTVSVGAGILSFGPQITGSGLNEVFTPAFSVACFASGTRIATVHGEIAVEHLREGDAVVSALGGQVPLRWIGHRRIDCRRHPSPVEVWPVRVRAGAFAESAPRRDLVLSPDHAVHVDGRLIPIRYLVNGASIVQEPVEFVTYWHVELPSHDVLLAEGLECESYLDTGNRAAFANGGTTVMAHADFSRAAWEAAGCAPLVVCGPAVDAVRADLLRRAAALGYRSTLEPSIAVRQAGRLLAPRQDGDALVWDLPAGTDTVELVSRSAVPSWTDPTSEDGRRLGIAVASLSLDGRMLPAAARGAGWHAAEAGWQWTDGAATIAVGPGRLSLTVAVCPGYWEEAA